VIDANGFRRRLSAEVIDLQQAQREQEYWEQRLSEPSEQERVAMQIVQQDHENLVNRDKAAAIYQAKEQDQANALAVAAQQEQDAEISQLSGNHVISPAVGGIPEEPVEAKPRRMRKRFVNRNGTWLRTKRLKRFHVGEKVFIRNSAGEFISIGVVNKRGGLPAAYFEN
jgi:hypothetical protein